MNPPHATALQVLLFAEGNPGLAQEVQRCLQPAAYQVHHFASFASATQWISAHPQQPPDVVVIDVPAQRSSQSMNAFRLYGFVRTGGWLPGLTQRFAGWGEETPVVMLIDAEQRLEVEERMYELGVQPDRIDYKPFAPHLLINRLDHLLQRGRSPAPGQSASVLRFGSLLIDPTSESVSIQGKRLKLSQLEYELLHFLASQSDTAVSREKLLKEIWGITGAKAVNNRSVDVYIGRLRKKLAGTPYANLIQRGHNGAYILKPLAATDNLTEPENVTKTSAVHAAQMRTAALVRTTADPHLPNEFVLEFTAADQRHRAGIKIGRNGSQCDWVLLDKRVSRWHATLFFDGATFYLRDEQSSGHTYIHSAGDEAQSEPRQLEPRLPERLKTDDVLYFNTIGYRFILGDG